MPSEARLETKSPDTHSACNSRWASAQFFRRKTDYARRRFCRKAKAAVRFFAKNLKFRRNFEWGSTAAFDLAAAQIKRAAGDISRIYA